MKPAGRFSFNLSQEERPIVSHFTIMKMQVKHAAGPGDLSLESSRNKCIFHDMSGVSA